MTLMLLDSMKPQANKSVDRVMIGLRRSKKVELSHHKWARVFRRGGGRKKRNKNRPLCGRYEVKNQLFEIREVSPPDNPLCLCMFPIHILRSLKTFLSAERLQYFWPSQGTIANFARTGLGKSI